VYNYSAWKYTSGSLGRGSTKSMTTDALEDVFAITSEIDDYGLRNLFNGCTGLTGSISFPKLTSVGKESLYMTFKGCTGLTGSISFPKLKTVEYDGLRECFNGCTGLTGSIEFPELEEIKGMYKAFCGCTGLTGSVSFPKLKTISYSSGLSKTFYNDTGLTSISFPALESISQWGMQNTFYGCTGLTSVSFPKLTTLSSYALSGTFNGCTNLKEVHFHYSLEGNSQCTASYMGCSNATVYFDLGCTVAPSGRRYYRHSSGMGSVMIWDDNGTRRETLILDMQYQDSTTKRWGDISTDISGITNYTSKAFSNDGTESDYILGASDWTQSNYASLTDTTLDEKFIFRDEHTSKENTDALVASLASSVYPSTDYASNYCRSFTVDGVCCDLPNMQTLIRIFCDKDTIHSLDPTDTNNNWGEWFGYYSGIAWSSTEYDGDYAWYIYGDGAFSHFRKKTAMQLAIPVLDIS
jgi:hypothetical protein